MQSLLREGVTEGCREVGVVKLMLCRCPRFVLLIEFVFSIFFFPGKSPGLVIGQRFRKLMYKEIMLVIWKIYFVFNDR